eukprot:Nitzschia sp. Nitz4//scaffold38_size140716//114451//114921//NITZ4_003166-RA/size140716-processed-gene-0.49-mRNA-1//1//CDS//3329550135//8798//frame0
MLRRCLVFVCISVLSLLTSAFVPNPIAGKAIFGAAYSQLSRASPLFAAPIPKGTPPAVLKRIQGFVEGHPVFLFMKGPKDSPQCGFSDGAVRILQAAQIDFESFDVLSDDDIRQGIKEYSNWPTIPQLYIHGEFIGGLDILLDLFKSGELQQLVKK